MGNVDAELEAMLAKPEFLADPVFSRAQYLPQSAFAMMGRFLRATNQPKEYFGTVKQAHMDANSACAMAGVTARAGIFVVWVFDLEAQGPNGKSGLELFTLRSKKPEANMPATASAEVREYALIRGILSIQTDSPKSPPATAGYQLCELKKVGWYVAALIPPGPAAVAASQPGPAAASAPQAAPPRPENVQIREDSRTLREFYPDAGWRHKVHYGFAHLFLPRYVRQNPAAFYNHIFPTDAKTATDPTRFVQSQWKIFEEGAGLVKPDANIVKNGILFRRVTDPGMEALRLDDKAIALVRMPTPERPIEAYFVAVVLQPVLRIFTLEAMAAQTSEIGAVAVLCEWLADRRQNHGIGVRPERDAFLKAIVELMGMPETRPAAGFAPPAPEKPHPPH